jgi:hypothetical protein
MNVVINDKFEEFPTRIELLCGNTAHYDHESEISYRCDACGATVFSIAMPKVCKELYEKEQVWETLSK